MIFTTPAKAIKDTKVLVAMSGGVDSSVVAVLLKRMGYQVTGVTLQLARSSCGLGACCTGPDLEDVKQLCRQEGFEHHTIPAYEDFKDKVINYTVEYYAKGLTPSPCVWCNSKVRFDRMSKITQQLGCDLLATGHYAYVQSNKQGFSLLAGTDPNKDQSYFLSMLPKHIIGSARFPLGNMNKVTVRKIAQRLGLSVASKKDSQDLCFVKDSYWQTVGAINPEVFKPGFIKNLKGEVLGQHEGIAQFTIGQRKGLGPVKQTSNRALYVVDINAQKNEVVVGDNAYTAATLLFLTNVNLIEDFQEGMFVYAKVRARSKLGLARLWSKGQVIEFCSPILDVARGQICVMYDGRKVVGAGLISNFVRANTKFLN